MGVGALIVTLSGTLLAPVASSAAPANSTAPEASSATEGWNETAYRGSVDVVDSSAADRETVTGTVFVTQPRGYQVPVDEDNVFQFHYHHRPGHPKPAAIADAARKGREIFTNTPDLIARIAPS